MLQIIRFTFFVAAAALIGCRTTKPATEVRLVDNGGQQVYVGGAAGPGLSQGAACTTAVNRAVRAIALRFAQENDSEADDIADAVGVKDGAVFMERFARDSALNAAVQDVQFDPADHLCLATVRWTPPVFVEQAVLKYAERLKADELAGETNSTEPVRETKTPEAPSQPQPRADLGPPPPASGSVAPAPRPQGPSVPECSSEKKRFASGSSSAESALDDFAECKRRTDGDEDICIRYKLYVDEAQEKQRDRAARLAQCLNRPLEPSLQSVIRDKLPTHAALVVENRDDGTLIVWAYSPLESTSYALEIDPQGTLIDRSSLVGDQRAWLRSSLRL